MRFPRRIRVLAAFVALAALLVGQAGLAAHVCPGGAATVAMAMVADGGDGHEGCDRKVVEPQDTLCDAHCQQGDQSRDTPAVPVPAAIVAANAWRVDAAPQPASLPPGEQRSLLARAAAPPLAVRHCRFQV